MPLTCGMWRLLPTILLCNIASAEDPALSKSDRPFPLSKPIHGYKYGQVVELTKRDDGFYIKADAEYRKARDQIEEFRVTTFNERLTDKTIQTQVPTPSVERMFVKEDVTYATWDKRALLLDLYGPEKNFLKKRPVIIVVHGGGWGVDHTRPTGLLRSIWLNEVFSPLPSSTD
jgi:acetyl esterase/lipase